MEIKNIKNIEHVNQCITNYIFCDMVNDKVKSKLKHIQDKIHNDTILSKIDVKYIKDLKIELFY